MSHTENRPNFPMRIPGIAWAVMLLYTLVYEIWAIKTDNPTLSAFVWAADEAYPWFKYCVLLPVAYLMYHFFWQKH